ncbi:MAG: Mrp/NBP35 family ATP-binding protein [Candidatus Methylacidiphilales bacterium]|nr:Mrp/NBP35 family ATP-binding protein [Candidatus Methylacidiphilales bacterium]
MITEQDVRSALGQVKYPGFSRDIISFGLVKGVVIEAGKVGVLLEVTTSDAQVPRQLEAAIRESLGNLPGVRAVEVDIRVTSPMKAVTEGTQQGIPGVRHIIAVASGKGGVGKSTVASNLAVALQLRGLKVGLLDCDLYGPSMGLMFGTAERPTVTEDERINPIEQYGLKLMGMSFLIEDEAPVILRGPMVTRYTQQFLRQVNWGELDVLVLDLPPGTGDIQLTIVQTVALAGAVIVTTPQEVALIDARKAVKMFEKVNVKVLGLVENMSFFACPSDGKKYFLFGEEGGKREAARLGVPLLGEIPIDIDTRKGGDTGRPVVLSGEGSLVAKAFRQAAEKLAGLLPR